MDKRETGEFIFRYYRKRTASFLVNLYKASITGDIEDIHRTRVDVKKILALFRLFEMVSPEFFHTESHFLQFRKLYRLTGRIREIQINRALISEYDFYSAEMVLYQKTLKRSEERLTGSFLVMVKEIEESALKKSGMEIRHLAEKSGQKKLVVTASRFIQKRARTIGKLLVEKKSPEYLHKVRQNLKNIGAIASLSQTIKRDKKTTEILSDLTRIEQLIGAWHDRQVFLESMNHFAKTKTRPAKEGGTPLGNEEFRVREDCLTLEKQILPQTGRLIGRLFETRVSVGGK
jgi:CHAD domain-containing protein